MPIRRGAALAAAALLILLAFGGSFGLHRFFDDWLFASTAMEALDQGLGASLLRTLDLHWSPLAWAIEAINLRVAGAEADWFIRLISMGLVALHLAFLRAAAGEFRLSATATLLSFAVLALHHVSSVAYYTFDGYSQLGADVLGDGALVLVLSSIRDRKRRRGAIVGAVSLFLAALLLKEQAITALFGTAAIVWWHRCGDEKRGFDRRLGAALAAMLAIAILFASIRWSLGAAADETGPYAVCISCAPGNAGLLLGAVLMPLPTADVYLAARDGHWLSGQMVVAGASLAMLVAVLVPGVVRARLTVDRRAPLVVALLLLHLFPVALLARVTELHAHALLFWFSLTIALAYDALTRASRRGAASWVGLGLAVMYAVVLYMGQRTNLGELRETGRRAGEWLARIERATSALPASAAFIVVGWADAKGARDYSPLRLSQPAALLGFGRALPVRWKGRSPQFLDLDEPGARHWRRDGSFAAPIWVLQLASDGVTVRALDSRAAD